MIEGLDPEQVAAAKAPQGASLVVAGAGTGKTTTLTARISWLMDGLGIPASEIMAVTFTNRAAREIRERVQASVKGSTAGLRLGTFHGLSARILRRHAEAAGFRDASFGIADEDDQRSFMQAAAVTPGAFGPFVVPDGVDDENGLKAARKDYEAGLRDFVKKALRQVSLWKSWGLTDAEASDPARAFRDEATERLAVAYSAYQYELESRNMADFGDLILKAVTLFEKRPDILEQEAGSVRHLLVDEGQDANPVQVRWARMLCSVHGGITVVGDDDQNIYGFQGGYPGAMEDMAGPSAARYALTRNRRCTEEILRPANLAVDYNRRREPKALSSGRHGEPVRATGHATEASEAAWVAARVREAIDEGTDPSSIAILFRTTGAIAPFEEALARKNVPSVVTSGKSLLEREEARDVLAMVRLAVNPMDDVAFHRLATRPPRGLGSSAIEALTALSSARGVPFHQACFAACDPKSGLGLRKDGREGAAALGRALALLAEDGKWGRPPWDMISIGMAETGYSAWLEKQENALERFRTVEAVQRLSEGYDDAREFLDDILLLTDGDTGDLSGRVRLSTMHSVKGLEFDHVFCPGFDQSTMPNPRSVEEGRSGKPGDRWDGPQGGGIEEERRLAHVAFTRARHRLDVSFAWRKSQRGRPQEGGPSSFIEECELAWEDMGTASTADLGRKKSRRRAGRVGFGR